MSLTGFFTVPQSGKLDLYVAGAGFRPSRILPCVIDVGTNNTSLRNDPLYIGLDEPRLDGDEYYEVVDEVGLVSCLKHRLP